jgi:2-polyprenyl-6-methoxyphenol hydroxylase-like FAD-dependent oxidoreductase
MPVEHPLIIPPEKPKILIVGAGIGGLMLAILLEKAGAHYEVYDRITEIKPLGKRLWLWA